MQKELKKQIERLVYYLKYYDEHRHFPFEKKRICITISHEAYEKLKENKNKSCFIENKILE